MCDQEERQGIPCGSIELVTSRQARPHLEWSKLDLEMAIRSEAARILLIAAEDGVIEVPIDWDPSTQSDSEHSL